MILEYVNNTAEYEVVTRVICNMSGLARALRRDGCIENESDFKDFTLGFTQGKATFDFIDVGYGKERADSKIRGTCQVPCRSSAHVLRRELGR